MLSRKINKAEAVQVEAISVMTLLPIHEISVEVPSRPQAFLSST